MSDFWELVAHLTDLDSRRSAARALARSFGAEDLIVFVRDPEIEVLIPALGFPQTLPRGTAWPEFIAEIIKNGKSDASLPSPYKGEEVKAYGDRVNEHSALVMLGEEVARERYTQLMQVMPVITTAFTLERRASRAGQLAKRARDAADQARALASGLTSAQRDLERALDQTSRTKDRFAFLAEVGTMLAASLNHEATLAGVARLVLPRLADVIVIDLHDEGENLTQVASLTSPDHGPRAATVLERHLKNPSRIAFAKEVMRKLLPWSLDETEKTLTDVSEEEEVYSAMLRADGVTAAIIIPITARRRCFGAVTLASVEPGRFYDNDEMGLAEDLARRIGLATSNSLLYVAAQSAIRAREEFLSIASHEFRTPVASIKLALQSLERNVKSANASTSVQVTRIETALEQVDRLDKLTNKLFDVTRIATGQLRLDFETFNLVDLVRDVSVRLADDAQRARCAVAMSGDDHVTGSWDRIRVDQVVVNLLTNALRYGDGKPVGLAVEARGDWARLTVRDQGNGIPREAQGSIFQRFERANASKSKDGLGLGLYITRQIVEAHGGVIRVISTPGEGASFIVELPRAQTA